MAEFDWSSVGPSGRVRVLLTPRPSYNGRELKPEIVRNAGMVAEVGALWLMDEDDPYPGEWALGYTGEYVFGVAWVASGDVTVLPSLAGDETVAG